MHIAVYAFDGITMFHLSIPQMVFGTVSRLGLANWQVSLFTTASESATPPEETVAPEEDASPSPPSAPSRTAAIRTSEGYILGGLGGPELAGEADVIVVPAWFSDGRPAEEELRSLLKTAHARGACVVGLCLGAIPLAEAGLIGGRRAVTHWRAFEPLAREHPEIALDESVLYVDHGDVLTSAGAASGLDACLHLVRTHLGAQAANEVARQLVIAPAAWVRAQRVREAQRLLESTDLAIEQVASTCGFGSAITMRQAFARILSTTPSAYRRRFCTVSPEPSET